MSHSLSIFVGSTDGTSKDTRIFWYTKGFTGPEMMTEKKGGAPESIVVQRKGHIQKQWQGVHHNNKNERCWNTGDGFCSSSPIQ